LIRFSPTSWPIPSLRELIRRKIKLSWTCLFLLKGSPHLLLLLLAASRVSRRSLESIFSTSCNFMMLLVPFFCSTCDESSRAVFFTEWYPIFDCQIFFSPQCSPPQCFPVVSGQLKRRLHLHGPILCSNPIVFMTHSPILLVQMSFVAIFLVACFECMLGVPAAGRFEYPCCPESTSIPA